MEVKSTYSNNNLIGDIKNKGERVQITVSNRELKERSLLYADDEDDLQILVDAVLRFWAAREIDYKYYPRTYLPWGKDTFYRFDILGTRYRGEKAQEKAEELAPGDIVLLVREGDNPQDENAIRVTTMDGTNIGYVPSRRCYDISSMVDNVGMAIVESNNLYDGESITVLFAFQNCEFKNLDWEIVGTPKPRLRVSGSNPIRGKYFDVVGRFKTLGNKSDAIRYLEDLGGIPYWHEYKIEPQIVIIGDGSQEKVYDEVALREKNDPKIHAMLESEIVSIIEEKFPGFFSKQAKAKAKPKKEVSKEISNARSYISKNLKKLETGTGNMDLLQKNIQERVNLLLSVKEPIGDDLQLRLMYAGIQIE